MCTLLGGWQFCTERPMMARLREATLKVLQMPRVREQFAALALDPGSGASPEELGRMLRTASDKQAATLKAIGFKPE